MKVIDKKVIVTGAGSGIGRQLVLELLERKANVIGVDVNPETLEETKRMANNNEHLELFVVDLGDETAIQQFKEDYLKKHNQVDILINNAGIIQKFVYVKELDATEIKRVMNINFFGMVNLTKAFLPKMLEGNEGHIVNVSSMGGFFPFPGQTIYGASKAAVKIFSEGLFAELLDTNVHVTTVFPGAINTNIAKNSGVEIKVDAHKASMRQTESSVAAKEIIQAIENNQFQLYIGVDAKMMNLLYKINPKWAIQYINKKMKNMM